MDLSKHIIKNTATIIDALRQINNMGKNEALTLFVVSSDNKIIGSLTDGDIRRCLINGMTVDTKLDRIAHLNFAFLTDGIYDIKILHDAKARGVDLIPVLDAERHIIDLINLKKQKSCLPIDAVLMAGGKGERLRPLTVKTPKPLLDMGGKAIIDYIIEHIISYGIKNISVTVNYLKEQIEEHFAGSFEDIQVKTVREPKFLGTIGGLSYVQNFRNDIVLLMNSDAITDINLEDFYLHFREHDADMSVAAIPYTISVPYGILDIDGQIIKGIQEKPKYDYYANTGIYLIRREFLSLIPHDEFLNATDFMELMVAKGYKVVRYPLNGTWIDIGSMQEYQRAKEMIRHTNYRQY